VAPVLDALLAWLSWGSALAVRAGGGVIASREFWSGLVATLVGVLIAFRLERRREGRRALEQYARHLSAVRYESAQLHAVCQQALAGIPKGAITSYDVDAPALRGLVSGPELQEHAPHGLAMVLISLLAVVGAARNSLGHYRNLVTSAGYSTTLLTTQLAPLAKHLTRLLDGIESAQGLLDGELKRLGRGVKETAEDKAVIQAFRDATKG
jgi:hypothetical protein